MVHPPDTPKAGGLYHIVIYKARLLNRPKNLPSDEVQGIIALTTEQVIQGLDNRPTLAELLGDGALLVAGGKHLDRQVQLYPLGTARALAYILRDIDRM